MVDMPIFLPTAERALNLKLEEISEEHECEVAIVTVYSLEVNRHQYADDFLIIMATVWKIMTVSCLVV